MTDNPRAMKWDRKHNIYESEDKNVRVLPLKGDDKGLFKAHWREGMSGTEADYTVLEAVFTTIDRAEEAASEAWDRRWA